MSIEEDERLGAGLAPAILAALADGVTVQDADGSLLYATDSAAQLIGFDSSAELLATPIADVIARFEVLDEERQPLPLELLPGRTALGEGREASRVVCYRIRETGEERWSAIRALPIELEDGRRAAVNVIRDVTSQRRAAEQLRFLSDASELLASSLDTELTIEALASMLVPGFADYCLIDLVEPEGGLRQAALRHNDPEREQVLREIRERYPPAGNPDHPATVVLKTGAPLLIATADDPELERAARDDSHLRLYRLLNPSSYLVVPLLARGRTIGTLSLGMGESGRHYSDADIVFAQDVAGRIALGVDNTRLYAEASESLALLDTLLVSSPVAIGYWDRELRFVRVNAALAEINHLSEAEHLGRTIAEVIPGLAPTLEPLYRRVLETGEPVVHEESTDEQISSPGSARHWLSSYYPVRTEAGETIGVGGVIMEITGQRRADARLRLLAEAGELFGSSLELEAILEQLNRVVLPRLADSLHVFLADDGVLRRAACAHVDPELQPVVESMPDRYELGPDSPAFMARVFEQAEAVLFSEVSTEFYEHLERLGADRDALERVGSRSMMLVPLVARGEPLGVLAMGSRQLGRYTDADVTLATELAGRAAAAIDNARLVRELTFRTTVLEAQQEASLDGLLLVSPEGEMISYNRRFAELWEFSDELIEQGSDDAALAEAMTKVVEPEAFIARVQYLYEHPDETSREEILLKGGRVLDRYGTAVRSPGGRYYGFLWSFRDVTEAKRAEAELERRAEASQALEFVADGVVLLDPEGTVRLWNPAAEAITGVRAAELIGNPLAEVIPGWSVVAAIVPLTEPRDGGAVRAESVTIEIGGRELWISISGVAFGEGTVYAFRDLTEERAVERLKSDFVSTVSHELRTPLAAIYGAAMTLKRDDVPLSDDQRDGMLGVVAGESERLARIVNDILLASRLDSDAVEVTIGPADAKQLVETVAAAASAHMPEGIVLSVAVPADLPPVSADADKVRQVLVNLVENAIKYSPNGGEVRIELEPVNGRMRFSVSDHGLGIPASEHGRIFEKFYRLDPNLTRGVGGTGLGLYISREIVRRLEGRLWVESEPGRGSTFTFDLPLA
jgi:PAS domain S-box-containing protein